MNISNGDIQAEPDFVRRRQILEMLIKSGVEIIDPDRTYVGEHVRVAPGAQLFPGTHLRGSTSIAAGCRIGPDCWIEDTVIEGDCTVRYSFIEKSRIRKRTTVGPYAHLRPGADVGPEARIGNFVEIKHSRLARGVKAGHLAYIGDADVGEDANIGAGTITCNYDGQLKHRTVIEREVFVGSNATLVAPVTIGAAAYIAAGSVITEDVPASALAFGRARQLNKKDGRKAKEDEADDQ